MNHKDKVSGHKSSEIFCSLQPNFLASLEFSLNLFSNIFQINTSTTFSEFILAVYFWKNCTSLIHVLTPQAIFVAWWVAGSTGTQLTPVNSSPPSFHSFSEILYFLVVFDFEEILISDAELQDSILAKQTFVCDGRMETSGMPNVPQTYPRTMIPVLRKLHTKWKGGRVGTSNFRRLMSCWINWYPVDPSQLVPSLLPLLLGNLIFPRRLRLWGNTDFRCGAPGFYPGKTNLCLWRADGDIRRLPHAA